MGLDIQSRRRKARDKETLAKRLAKERKEQREKEREEKEMSRITDNPLAALAVKRPDAPNLKEGVSLGSLTGSPAATVKPSSPPKDGGPIDWEAVAESNPGQPKKPVVFVPPGSQKAEADKLLPGGEQGPEAPPEDNTIDQFADAAEEAGERVDERSKRKEEEIAAAIESGNEGEQEASGVTYGGTRIDDPEGDPGNPTLIRKGPGFDTKEISDEWLQRTADDLFDDIDSNLKAQLDDYAAENPIEIEGDQEADPEALAEADLNQSGMMNVGEEEDEPVEEYAGGITPEFWADRLKAPVQDVRDVMKETELAVLSENPEATPEEIKQAQIVALETDEDLARHKEVHEDQIQAAVHRQADQTNRARIMGVPRGMVMMLDQINDAQTPDEIVKGLITASGVYPQFRPMLQNVITGQVSANSLKSQLAAAMMQMQSAEKIAALQANARKQPEERTTVNILENFKAAAAEFTPQSVLAAKTYAAEMGQTEDLFNITALAFAEPMKAVAMKMLSPQGASDDEITTAKEVINLAMNGDRPQLNDINRLFGSTLSAAQAEHIVRLLYGDAGVAATRTGGPARKWINDATGGRWEPVDAINGALDFVGAEGFPRVNEPRK